MKHLKISIVIPMRNSSSTILETLKSIFSQDYPIEEIIVVDDMSTDSSGDLVKKFRSKNKKIKITLLQNKTHLMIARSISRGFKASKSPYVVLTHSDCLYVSRKEIAKLVSPIEKDNTIIATYGYIYQSLEAWGIYSFWEKMLFAYGAGKKIPGLTGKIDCYKKEAYESIGGHDDLKYYAYGGEDADLHFRLKKIGKVKLTSATITHVNHLHGNFSLKDLITKKKQTAGAYGRQFKFHASETGLKDTVLILIKPILVISSLIPIVQIFAFIGMVGYIGLYYKRMFLSRSTLLNIRIVLLPFVALFLIYFESFWTIKAIISN